MYICGQCGARLTDHISAPLSLYNFSKPRPALARLLARWASNLLSPELRLSKSNFCYTFWSIINYPQMIFNIFIVRRNHIVIHKQIRKGCVWFHQSNNVAWGLKYWTKFLMFSQPNYIFLSLHSVCQFYSLNDPNFQLKSFSLSISNQD